MIANRLLSLGYALIACWATCLALCACAGVDASSKKSTLVATVADVQAVHDTVTLRSAPGDERPVLGLARVAVGDRLVVSEHGRARMQLDDGTLLVLDGNSQVTLSAAGATLEQGRLFVESPVRAQTKIEFGSFSTVVSGASVSFRNQSEAGSVYCAQGELVLVRGNTQTGLGRGETARIRGETVEVAPEVAFDDWTGGLAVPWSSEVGSRSAIPELRAVSGDADPGTPLVTRKHDVKVTIAGEVARTTSVSTYFNGGPTSSRVRAQVALPNGAIITRLARHTPTTTEANIAVVDGPSVNERAPAVGLEWAGGGYLSGELGPIDAGQVMSLELEYVEWLPRGNGTAHDATRSYRYPMLANPALPPVGALSIELEATHAGARWVSASKGALASDKDASRLVLRGADVHPTADFVAEVTHNVTSSVRAYVQGELSSDGDEASPSDAPYVLLRADLPEQTNTGLTLALVVDTSMSAGGATFETSRAVVDALLYGLSPDDEVVVFTADQVARPLGSADPRPLTPVVRDELRSALSSLRPGGASNLEAALSRAADALDAPSRGNKAGTGVVVYVGDGRPTLGVSDVVELRRGLLRRDTGSPRLSAVAVGPNADKWALARLTAGSGEVYEVLDRADAAQVGARLLASALQPTWRDVEFELGAAFDRIYPRNPRSSIQGATVTVVGRLRSALPSHVGLRFRKGATATTEAMPVERLTSPEFNDVSRRWALARIDDIAGTESAIEPAIALAYDAKLLTPWTGWFFSAPHDGKGARRFSERVLTLSSERDAPYGSYVDPVLAPGTMLLDQGSTTTPRISLKVAADLAVRRVLRRAANQIRACRQSRLGVKPDLALQFSVNLSVDGEGRTTRVVVRSHDSNRPDLVVERCIERVIRGLPQVASGVSTNLTHVFTLPEMESKQPTKCSDVSRISLPLRQSVWRTRLPSTSGYLQALRSCEVPRWRDKRAYLDLVLETLTRPQPRLEAAVELTDAGQTDAAQYLRHETLRRVTHFEELHSIPAALLDDEPALPKEFDQAYARASDDAQRLEVVRRFVPLAPHDAILRKRLLSLLETLGRKDELLSLIRAIRSETVVDAGLLAASASALRRLGLLDEGAQVFGELLERAPGDPWTLAYVGDRLRAEQLFDEAVVVYEQLARVIPADAGVGLRLALAHAGGGRLDVATRLLQGVAATGGRDENGRLGDLGAIIQAVLLADALQTQAPGSNASDSEARANPELVRRLKQTPLPDVANIVLVDSPPSDNPVQLRVTYEADAKSKHIPNFDASPIGVNATLVERGASKVTLQLSRNAAGDPVYAGNTHLYVLTPQRDGTPTLQKRELNIGNDGVVTLALNGGQLL